MAGKSLKAQKPVFMIGEIGPREAVRMTIAASHFKFFCLLVTGSVNFIWSQNFAVAKHTVLLV